MSNDRKVRSDFERMPEKPIYYNEIDNDGYVDYDAKRPGSSRQGSRRSAGRSADEYREDVRGYERNRPQYGPRDNRVRRDSRPRPEEARRRPEPAHRDERDYRDDRRRSGRDTRKNSVPRRKKKNPFKSFLITVLVCVLIILAIGMGFSYAMTKKAYGMLKYESAGDFDKEALTADGVTNILLIGNDSRLNGEDGRSDAMILVSISKTSGKILMTSILRDVYVEIPGYGSNRLNAAYAFGGPELLMETIQHNFDIPVSRYILVNFEAFAGVVDAVGGVDIELTVEEIGWVNAYLNEYNELTGHEFGYNYLTQTEPGVIHLNGPQALAYSRNRYVGTDFGRTERQRKVMEEIIKKLPRAVITNMDGLMEGLCPNLTTNLTMNECYGLVLRLPFMLKYERVSGSIPLEGTWWDQNIDGMAVLGIDFEANKNYLHENLYVKPEKTTEEETTEP
ncbi:MAG: LCP family protein [Lachnospiraceae bacterium]|nr:LCP family protein [Lachnospiraceae bacterium]